ncbi:hypothetical protein [Prevotellamassilia timonensis]|uniref:hypothetical protein n=1 Tax=Prevotellamassilia timonensis TaxID=1852370 RepID=UPI0023F14563|nr:hypothetical protein [Prevotellamassilia timonensis]MDD7440220.1 hypothetical protein [Prevotellamassilia timonensis]
MSTFDTNISKKHNPFVVPENYLASFPELMMQRIAASAQCVQKAHNMFIVRWIPWLGAACVAALLVLFSQIQQSQMSDVDTHISAQSSNGDSHADAAYDYLMMANANNIETYDYDY